MRQFANDNETWQQCVLCNTDPVPAWCHFLNRNITNKIAAIPPAMLATTFMNTGHHVSLCLQMDGNKFQYLLYPNLNKDGKMNLRASAFIPVKKEKIVPLP
jgi:hypothetical protein